MPEIGTTLRERRIRDKIDITTVEDATKIRAKYLRALENEEWAVLPGPAYVKSFLRTYAEFLGIDAHMLVEEYRARYERPEELEVAAFSRNHARRGRVRPPGPPSRAGVVVALVLGILVLLFILGITNKDEGSGDGSSGVKSRTGSGNRAGSSPKAARRQSPTAGPGGRTTSTVLVSVTPARDSWICLVDSKGVRRIEGRTVAAGQDEGPFRSARFRITVGNGGGDFRVNGKLRDVPDRSKPLGYAISPSGVRLLPAAQQPTCQGSGTTSPAGRP
jgi:hypothetical protein